MKCARRCSGVRAPRSISSVWMRFMAPRKSLSGPAQRAEWMPGSPPSASTTRPEIVGERRLAGGARGGFRLDARIGGEGGAGLFRLGEAELAGRLRLDAVGRQQFAHLAQLAGIVRGDDDRAGEEAGQS